MSYQDVVILIPSHSLEDFPSEQGEVPAAGLLNAFAIAWHPRILASMVQLPRWHRADDPPQAQPQQLVIVPSVCDGWLPHDWVSQARAAEAVVIDGLHDRGEMAAAALSPLDPLELELDADLVADFYALGTCWLLVELLTRHMRNFGNIDEVRFQNRVIAGARAVVAGDRETAIAHLRSSFEILLEARERFYSVDCYLLDVCLVIPSVATDPLLNALRGPHPMSVMVNGADLDEIARKRPDIVEALRDGVASGRVSLVGGSEREVATPLMPLNSWLLDWERGLSTYQRLAGRFPRIWGQRRYGLFPTWPQLLSKSDFLGSLHVVVDDGIYPDSEHSRLRWQGCDGTVIDAISRIPLAADTASTYLRYPARMADTMDHDQVAALTLARWPDVKAPWFEDLRRSQKYAPVLGKFVTFEQLFETSPGSGRLSQYSASEYFTPFFIQHAARRDPDAISRYARHLLRRRRFDAINWCRATAALLRGNSVETEEARALEIELERCGPDRASEAPVSAIEERLASAQRDWPAELARIIMSGSKGTQRGTLLINPEPFPRRTFLTLPADVSPPPVRDGIKLVQKHAESGQHQVIVDLAGCGYAWVPLLPSAAPAAVTSLMPPKPPAVPEEGWILANERFEVTFNEETGGILQIRHPRKRENRLSQLVSYRFPRERQVTNSEGEGTVKSYYAETRCTGFEAPRTIPEGVEAVTTGDVIDTVTSSTLASFRQTTRLLRHAPWIEIDLDVTNVTVPDGDPWNNYLCVRFAWDSSTAAVTRCLLDGAQPFGGDRLETTDYIEVADESERLTIIPHGLPFHRKTGPRMLDSLLCVHGETQRRFRFTIAIDQSYPLEVARDVLSPVLTIPTEQGPPRSGPAGWLFHVDARNVQLARLLDLMPVPKTSEESTFVPEKGFAVRLVETEGYDRPVRFRSFRQPLYARKRDLLGRTLRELPIEGDAILIDLGAYEFADVEIRYGN